MLHLIIGGSGSGKSAYGERLMLEESPQHRIYLATMQPWDEECREKIRRHRQRRKDMGFTTIECYGRLKGLDIPEGSSVLLECLGNLTANLFYGPKGRTNQEEKLAGLMTDDILGLQKRAKTLMIVSNDIFSDGLCYEAETENYRAVLGQTAVNLAKAADCVTEVVFGIPVPVKRVAGKTCLQR